MHLAILTTGAFPKYHYCKVNPWVLTTPDNTLRMKHGNKLSKKDKELFYHHHTERPCRMNV